MPGFSLIVVVLFKIFQWMHITPIAIQSTTPHQRCGVCLIFIFRYLLTSFFLYYYKPMCIDIFFSVSSYLCSYKYMHIPI